MMTQKIADKKMVILGFWAIGLTNIFGVLIFSKAFTNPYLGKLAPEMFSNFSLVTIMLWGLAYIAVMQDKLRSLKAIWVFAIEKAVYAGYGMFWFSQHSADVKTLFSIDPMSAVFFVIFWIFDGFAMIFFGVTAYYLQQQKKQPD